VRIVASGYYLCYTSRIEDGACVIKPLRHFPYASSVRRQSDAVVPSDDLSTRKNVSPDQESLLFQCTFKNMRDMPESYAILSGLSMGNTYWSHAQE
jgi:hypothetical protein